LAERSHNVDRYAKAAGLLDTDKIVVRQAGIYALRELGQVDPAGSGRVCIQLLSGFVRDRSHEFLKEARHEEFQAPEDLVDAIRAIGLINHVLRSQNIIAGINLVRIVATGASLGDLDLFSATFNNAFLDRASAHGGSWRQTFFGDTAMKGFGATDVDFSEAIFGGGTSLTDARFIRCKFDKTIFQDIAADGIKFIDCDCSGANFERAELPLGCLGQSWAWSDQAPIMGGVPFPNLFDPGPDGTQRIAYEQKRVAMGLGFSYPGSVEKSFDASRIN
jgi:hypothetical protein